MTLEKKIELFLLGIIILTIAGFIWAVDEDAKEPRKTYPIMEDSVRRKYFKDDCDCRHHTPELWIWL